MTMLPVRLVTVRVGPEIEATKLAMPEPRGQKDPAVHGTPVDSPCAHTWPAGQGFESAVGLPVPTQKPAAQVSPPVMTVAEETVLDELSEYVPTPPLPVPRAVMTVPAVTPVPERSMPTRSLPEETDATVRSEPAMVPEITGAVAPASVVSVDTVCAMLTVTAQGNALMKEQVPDVTVVPAVTPVPEMTMPGMSGPAVRDETRRTVPLMVPDTAAEGNEGLAHRPGGQK